MLQRVRESRPVHRLEVAAHEHGLDHVVLTLNVERVLLRMARVLGVMVIATFTLALLTRGAPDHEYVAWEQTASVVALGISTLGLVVAWWWQPGAALTMVAGVFVGALAAFQYNLLIALAVALLFMFPATLYLLAWQRTQSWIAIITISAATVLLLGVGAAAATTIYRNGHGAAHPASDLTALPDSPTRWMWSGGVTADTASVVANVPDGSEVRLAYATSPDLLEPSYAEAVGRGPIYRFQLDGLSSSTRYHYAVETDGRLDTVRRGTFTTFAAGPMDFSVAFGCGARTRSNGAVFDTIRELEPDLFLHTGDFNYGDVIQNSLGQFAHYFNVTLGQPAQAALYRSTPIAYVWDDHDYGPNDAAKDSPSREAALVSYRSHVPHYPMTLEGRDAPIAQTFDIGRVHFILTDNRSDRDPKGTPDGPDKSILGAEQLGWFLQELTDAMERYPLVVWVNSVPWIAAPEEGADHWGGYTHERRAIADAVAASGTNNLLMLAGDAHMLAIDDGSHSDYSSNGGGGFPVFQAAALDRIGSVKGGPYSEGAFPGGGQFGYITVEDRGDELRVRLTGFTWELEELVSLDLVFPA